MLKIKALHFAVSGDIDETKQHLFECFASALFATGAAYVKCAAAKDFKQKTLFPDIQDVEKISISDLERYLQLVKELFNLSPKGLACYACLFHHMRNKLVTLVVCMLTYRRDHHSRFAAPVLTSRQECRSPPFRPEVCP